MNELNGSLLIGLLLTGLATADPVKSFVASALGEVKAQGKFSFQPGASLLDLLGQAGGSNAKADLQTAVLVRDGKEIPVDLRPENLEKLR